MAYSSSEMMPRFTNSRAIDMAILYRRSWRACFSSIAAHLLSGEGITAPGAVFPSCFSVAFKDGAAMLADDPIKSLLVQFCLILFPPGHAAFIRAVPLRLLVGCLYKRFSAVAAQPLVIGNVHLGHRVSMAVNFYSILGNASKLRDLFGG